MRALCLTPLVAAIMVLPVAATGDTGASASPSQDVKAPTSLQPPGQAAASEASRPADRQVRIFRLDHSDAKTVRSLVNEAFSRVSPDQPGGPPGCVYDARTNSLIVTAPAEQFAQIEAIIAELDVQGAGDRMTRTFTLEYAEPWNLPEVIRKQLHHERGTGPDGAVTATYIQGTMSILVTAGPEQMGRVAALVEQADIPSASTKKQTKFIRLKHAVADKLAKVLKQVHQAATPRPRSKVYPVNYSADPTTNTLIVTAAANEFESIHRQVEALDVPRSPGRRVDTPYQTHVEIAVYEVTLAPDRVGKLDVEKLAAADETGAAFARMLGEIGKTKVLYRIDQPVDLGGHPTLTIGARRPICMGTRRTKSGADTTSVSYEEIGCLVDMSGGWEAEEAERGHVTVRLELSLVSESAIQVAPGVSAPVFHNVQQQSAGPVVSGKPIILLSVDASSGAKAPVAYVTRIVFTRGR